MKKKKIQDAKRKELIEAGVIKAEDIDSDSGDNKKASTMVRKNKDKRNKKP